MGSRRQQADARKRAFLDAFRLSGNVSGSARAVDIDRNTPYGWATDDPEFKAAWEVAEQESIDRLEQEARRRAEKGVEDLVVSGGKVVTQLVDGKEVPIVRRVYSDTLMVLLLKAHRPEKYSERQRHELAGSEGGPLKITLDFGGAAVPAVVDQGKD